MQSVLRFTAFAAVFTALSATLVSGQKPAPPVATARPGLDDKAAVPNAFRAKQVLGAKISIKGDTGVGTVDDIVLSDAGDVEYLIVATSDNKLITMPWSAVAFNFEQKTAVVNITQEQYKLIPTYTTTNYPQYFVPEYRSQVYKYYNLTPAQMRRIDRRNP